MLWATLLSDEGLLPGERSCDSIAISLYLLLFWRMFFSLPTIYKKHGSLSRIYLHAVWGKSVGFASTLRYISENFRSSTRIMGPYPQVFDLWSPTLEGRVDTGGPCMRQAHHVCACLHVCTKGRKHIWLTNSCQQDRVFNLIPQQT